MSISDGEALLLMQNGEDRAFAAREINKANAEIRRLRRELAKAKGALAVEVAHGTGNAGMVRAIKAAHPDLPEFKATGRVMPDGRPQVVLHAAYDKAFDERARELGIENPEQYREIAK